MPETPDADPLSIASLAAGIASLVLALFSVLPLAGMCLLPMSAMAAVAALITGGVSLVRTTLNPQLQGRGQAAMGIALALVWVAAVAVLALFVFRRVEG